LEKLHRFLNKAGPQTTGANAHAFGRPFDQRSNRAKVGPKDTFGAIVGVTDVVANLAVFSTDFT